MIRYALRCGRGHKFEAWFRDSSTYDMQASRGEVSCPHCGVIDIEKDMMAPAIKKSSLSEPVAPVSAKPSPALPRETMLAPTDKRQALLIEAMEKLRESILAEAEYVGDRFAEEARKMHDEDIVPQRPIYGEASVDEVRELIEEGVNVMAVPSVPKDRN